MDPVTLGTTSLPKPLKVSSKDSVSFLNEITLIFYRTFYTPSKSELYDIEKWQFAPASDHKIKVDPYGFEGYIKMVVKNKTLIAIEAPHGTTLEVLDLDEAVDYPQRKYRKILRSTMDTIDVYLLTTQGITVILTSRDIVVCEQLAKVLQERGLNVVFHHLDIVEDEPVKSFYDWVKEKYVGIDILYNGSEVGYTNPQVIPDPIQNLRGIKKTFQLHYNQKTSKGKLDFVIDQIMEISARNINATERNTNPATPPNETQ
ncbi:carbonyl reductase [NADPH] 1-like protein [Tanacetum coccineum]